MNVQLSARGAYFISWGEVVEGANSKPSAYLKTHFFLPQSFDLKVTPVFQVSNEQKPQHFAPRLERIFSLLSSVFERFVITTFLISDRVMSSNAPFSWDCTSSVILGFHMTFPKFQRGIIAPKHLYLYEFWVRKVSSLWVENGTDFLRFCYLNIPCPRINITLIFMSSSKRWIHEL